MSDDPPPPISLPICVWLLCTAAVLMANPHRGKHKRSPVRRKGSTHIGESHNRPYTQKPPSHITIDQAFNTRVVVVVVVVVVGWFVLVCNLLPSFSFFFFFLVLIDICACVRETKGIRELLLLYSILHTQEEQQQQSSIKMQKGMRP